MNASTTGRGVGGRKMAGCVAMRITDARTGSKSATGSVPLSADCSQSRNST